jgi:hypothetical protein
MRKCDIEIIMPGSTDKISLVEQYDFHLIESPARITAPIRDYETQAFPESASPEIDNRTVKQPFDYQISLAYWGSEADANVRIRSFFDSLFSANGDILTAKEITLINNYKGVQMKGYAKQWDEKTYTIEGEKGLIMFDFTLYVNDPTTLQ